MSAETAQEFHEAEILEHLRSIYPRSMSAAEFSDFFRKELRTGRTRAETALNALIRRGDAAEYGSGWKATPPERNNP